MVQGVDVVHASPAEDVVFEDDVREASVPWSWQRAEWALETFIENLFRVLVLVCERGHLPEVL